MARRRLLTKLGLSVALVGTSSGIAGLGTFGTFTSTVSASRTDSAGTVVIALGATGAATNRLTVNATNLAPGDTIQRSFDLANTGTLDLSGVTLTSTASPTSLLDTDATNGLQMVIDKCSTAWTEAGSSPAFTYTCGGSTSSVIASRAVIGSAVSMANLASTSSGGSDHLRVTLAFPATAGNTFQGLTSTISYAFTGTQRTATDK